MNYKYYEEDGKYIVVNDMDSNIKFYSDTQEEAKLLKDELNKLVKRVKYQERVIKKSIKLDKIKDDEVNDYKLEIANLKQENKILRKIIKEEMR